MNLPGLKTFLVPVNNSEASRRAKRYAIALAKQCGAKVVLFHAHGLISGRISPDGRERIIRKNLEDMGKVFAIFVEGCREASVEFEIVVEQGATADSIIKAAQDHACDMIIMGTKGQANARKILGSLTDTVSKHSTVPVVVVGEECECSNSCGTACTNKWRFAPSSGMQHAC
jgi:nucleotide-binding universal stress UspA family protein